MKKQYVIFDIITKEYFLGSNPMPCFGEEFPEARKFDSEDELTARMQREIEECDSSYFENRIFTIIPIYTPII